MNDAQRATSVVLRGRPTTKPRYADATARLMRIVQSQKRIVLLEVNPRFPQKRFEVERERFIRSLRRAGWVSFKRGSGYRLVSQWEKRWRAEWQRSIRDRERARAERWDKERAARWRRWETEARALERAFLREEQRAERQQEREALRREKELAKLTAQQEREALRDRRNKTHWPVLWDKSLDRPTGEDGATLRDVVMEGTSPSAEEQVLQSLDAERDAYFEDLLHVVEYGRKARELGRDPRWYVSERMGASLERVLKMEKDIDFLRRGLDPRLVSPHGEATVVNIHEDKLERVA